MQHVKIQKDYQHAKTEIIALINSFESSGEIVVNGKRNLIKKFNFLNNESINIKRFKKPKGINSFIYKYIRPSKAKRSFEYAEKLLRKGISTPKPIAYIEYYSVLGLEYSYYVSAHIDYDFDFRVLIHNPLFPNRSEILKQFSEFCFKLHENEINFLDHSPGNTLITDDKNGNYTFYLIDLNRMKFQFLTLEQRMNNLKRLWLSKQMIQIISQRYAEISTFSYDTIFHHLLKYSRAFKMKTNKKKYLKKKFK